MVFLETLLNGPAEAHSMVTLRLNLFVFFYCVLTIGLLCWYLMSHESILCLLVVCGLHTPSKTAVDNSVCIAAVSLGVHVGGVTIYIYVWS